MLKLDPQDVIIVAMKSFDEKRGEQDDVEAEV